MQAGQHEFRTGVGQLGENGPCHCCGVAVTLPVSYTGLNTEIDIDINSGACARCKVVAHLFLQCLDNTPTAHGVSRHLANSE